MMLGKMFSVSDEKRMALWSEMKQHLERHRRYSREKRTELSIVSEFYYCLGMLQAMRKLDLMDKNTLDGYEAKLYKPYR
jgi:hypothetical protein